MDDHDDESHTPVLRELFGGAMRTKLAGRFVDVSDFRPVPDHQEVFADSHTDESVIIEIMEHSPVDDPARHYLEDLAETNDAEGFELLEDDPVTKDAFSDMLDASTALNVRSALCTQRVAKFREAARNEVRVLLVVLQLPAYNTDLLLTLNSPARIHAASSSARSAGAGQGVGADAAAPIALMLQIAASFRIEDYSLFEPEQAESEEESAAQ